MTATRRRPVRSAGRRLGVGASLALVAGVFVLAHVPLALATAVAQHPEPPIIGDPLDFAEPATWSRFDSWHYLSVAERGPELFACGEGNEWQPDDWCGSSGWLPFYSLVVRATMAATGLDPIPAGVVVARAAFAATLALVWFAVLERRATPGRVAALVLAGVWAGLVYQMSVFPISTVVLAATGSAVLLARRRWAWAGVAAGIAAISHTMGVLAVGVGGLVILSRPLLGPDRPRWPDALRRAVAFTVPAACCLLAMFAWYDRSVGAWDAPYRVQDHYGHEVQNPFGVIRERVSDVVAPADGHRGWPEVQTAMVAATTLAVVAVGARRWRDLTAVERALVVAAPAWWLVPLSYGSDYASYYRLEAFTLPVAALAHRLPPWLVAALALLAGVTAYHVTGLFLVGYVI